MVKWIRLKTTTGITYFNADKIKFLQIRSGEEKVFDVVADTLSTIAKFETQKEAEQFIENFIAEHYIVTEKVK